MDHSPRFLKLVTEARKNVRECTVADVAARVARGERFVLVDVREESEFANGHLPGARHIGRGILERDVENAFPDPSAEIVLYCGGGFRSVLAAESLAKMGYTHVVSMDGGFRGWKEAGHTVEK
jgi:rhodanese-related sulfurtransferase